MSRLIEMQPGKSAAKPTKRRGRGNASGLGRQGGRGHKGWHSRSGSKHPAWYEGGQMPLQRRIPKRGFSNAKFREDVQIVNLDTITRIGAKKVDPGVLKEKGAIRYEDRIVKVLGNGELKAPVEVTATQFSQTAREKIEKAGGKAIVL